MTTTTVLTNIYNEEYLLPFWLNYHKNIFDHGIIVDYRSTDNSVKICKSICPTWEIITTVNEYFEAEKIDEEFMNIEKSITGLKIVLNTTEFLICSDPLHKLFTDLLGNNTEPFSLSISCISPYSINNYYPNNLPMLFKNMLNDDVKYHYDRKTRQLHNYRCGNYTIGRHSTLNTNIIYKDNIFIVWLGYYPMNDSLLQRKLQILINVPESDKARNFGLQHSYDKVKILDIMKEKYESGLILKECSITLYNIISKMVNNTYVVTGGCGFIGSHMVDLLLDKGYNVIIIDNLSNGKNINNKALLIKEDIRDFEAMKYVFSKYNNISGIFHFAAIARTPWCIDDPVLAYDTNVMGTLHILECAKIYDIKKVVLSSSNVVYAFMTPYRTSKEAVEGLAETYNKMYNLSVIALRYSNVYGTRQSEEGPSPNVFSALRKSIKDNGYLTITGDGNQTRDFTHVSDITNGNLLAMNSSYQGIIDLCTGRNVSLNYIAEFFNCPIKYIEDRPGDVKHIIQDPKPALKILEWVATVSLEDKIDEIIN
jgi:UDP-glucose 4-epimerase